MTTTPYQITFAPEEVQHLKDRIALTPWPDRFTAPPWSYGTDPDYLRELAEYWRSGFDFVAAADRLNCLPNFQTTVDGLPVHHLHVRAAHDNAVPVLLLHGWPGSIVEFLEVIPLLTKPADPDMGAFHVVSASLQGYGASPGPSQGGMSPRRIAQRMAGLMSELGYDRYLVQGGDWGSLVASHLAALYPDRVIGLHLSMAQPIPPVGLQDPLSVVKNHEKPWLAANATHAAEGGGYYDIQKTRPETLAYALTDSPVGWCAWVLDKFHARTDCERNGVRDIRNALSWDVFLTNLSLYWFTNTISSSIRLYREDFLAEGRGEGAPGRITVPSGVAIYPREIIRSPRAWMEHRLPLAHWSEQPVGGHFAALEQPQLFADDLRHFRNSLSGHT